MNLPFSSLGHIPVREPKSMSRVLCICMQGSVCVHVRMHVLVFVFVCV
jgi:hypothetical protein